MSRRALILVNQAHEDARFAELPGAVADAEQLSAVLRDPGIGAFEVAVVLNRSARTWHKEIQRFFAEAERDDILLLHLSCHGRKDRRNRLHFVARDSEFDMLEATSVSAEFLADCMEQSRSRCTVLLLDCCYSGAFTKGLRSRGEPEVDLGETFQGSGRVVITSSTALQYSYESELSSRRADQPSVFTAAVVDGLRSGDADLDQDGYVSVDDLYLFIATRVPEQVPDQTPTLSVTSVDGRIRLARNPNGARTHPTAAQAGDGEEQRRRLAAAEQRAEELRGEALGLQAQADELAEQVRAKEREVARHRTLRARALEVLAPIATWLVTVTASAAGLWTASLWAVGFVLPGSAGQRVLALLLCGTVQTVGTMVSTLPAVLLAVFGFGWVWARIADAELLDGYNPVRVRVAAVAGLVLAGALALAAVVAAVSQLPTLVLRLGAWLARAAGLRVVAPTGWDGFLTALSPLAAVMFCTFLLGLVIPARTDIGENDPTLISGTRQGRRWALGPFFREDYVSMTWHQDD
ncbi:caspase, EACC1-associated type [Kitasatospora sp. NBC_01266]|uniref:caspase, EACC1-associated type n=1 Tax=Kitasatospora sp. NBC_01266 TaxID=2903572 RepID=UPI002E358244|nr:caspase family protein [Kitasatospora sp. NBC_01266]